MVDSYYYNVVMKQQQIPPIADAPTNNPVVAISDDENPENTKTTN